MGKVFIIAEAGDNHNGKLELALKLVDKAIEAGADCVKFQTFITEEVVSVYAEKAEYQKKSTEKQETQYEMIKKLQLSFDDFRSIQEYCKKKGILFLSTPFDLPSIDFLQEIDMPFWKIPSGEITNLPYLIKIAQTHKPVVLSTGMASIEEIHKALKILRNYGAGKMILLHCNTEYPTPYEDVNLNAMAAMEREFGLEVGYSDHSLGVEVPIAAAAMGAVIIEKHFTLDKSMEGPDHKASLNPEELKHMVASIRKVEMSMGDGIKQPSKSEEKNILIARKSIVARIPIKKGELFTENNLAVKRPGNGISPMKWFDIIGTVADTNYERDELIKTWKK